MRLHATLGLTALWMALSTAACSSGEGDTTPLDAASADSTSDAPVDTSATDTSVPDTSVPDTSEPDTTVPDTTVPDTTVGDVGDDTSPADTGSPDAGEDGSSGDTASPDVAEDTSAPDTSATDTSATDTATADTATDSAIDAGPDAPPPTYPPAGYVGAACTDHADCTGGASAYCSDETYSVGTLNPTPVCLEVGSACTPSDDVTIRFCDEGYGLCLGSSTGANCLPLCTFDTAGNYRQACTGKNACVPELFAEDAGSVYAIGQCQGGCSVDADCPVGDKCDPVQRMCFHSCTSDATCTAAYPSAPSNWGCDLARGACTFKYPKTIGQTCSSSTECACLKSSSAATGYCTQQCRTGVVGECPLGFTCDAFLPKTDTTGATLFTAVPVGVSGYCAKNCASVADCPAGSVCEASGGSTQKTCRP